MLLKNIAIRLHIGSNYNDLPIADSLEKEELIKLLKAFVVGAIPVEKGQELTLVFESTPDFHVSVTLADKTADNPDDWYTHQSDELIVSESVKREKDLVSEYHAQLKSNKQLTQEEFIKGLASD